MRDYRIGSLFSGIGGLELGLERAGLGHTVWQAEQDLDCRAWLSDHWPGVPCYHDVRDVDASAPPVDVLCGGFPCQDLSPAGKRAGIAGARSGLWKEYDRAVGALRPRWVVVENTGGNAMGWLPFVRRDLWARGYASVPIQLRAGPLGGLHDRARVFVVADADGLILRQQPGRREWARRIEAALCAVVGAAGSFADAHRGGQLQSEGLERDERGRAGNCVVAADRMSGPAEPALVCPVHGVPADVAGRASRGRPARIRALGNAVIPAMAEVIGRLILDLEAAHA